MKQESPGFIRGECQFVSIQYVRDKLGYLGLSPLDSEAGLNTCLKASARVLFPYLLYRARTIPEIKSRVQAKIRRALHSRYETKTD